MRIHLAINLLPIFPLSVPLFFEPRTITISKSVLFSTQEIVSYRVTMKYQFSFLCSYISGYYDQNILFRGLPIRYLFL